MTLRCTGRGALFARYSKLFNGPFSLIGVPTDPRYRVALRLYAYDTIPMSFYLQISPVSEKAPLVTRVVDLFGARDHAFFLIGDLLHDHPDLVGKGTLRTDIRPMKFATLAWGYVSITNNDTQHVTVIAPE